MNSFYILSFIQDVLMVINKKYNEQIEFENEISLLLLKMLFL